MAVNYRFIKESARAVPTANAEPIAPAAPHSPTHVRALAEVNPTTFSQIPSSNFSPFCQNANAKAIANVPAAAPANPPVANKFFLKYRNCLYISV